MNGARDIFIIAAILLVGVGFIIYLIGKFPKGLFGKSKEIMKGIEKNRMEEGLLEPIDWDDLFKSEKETLKQHRRAVKTIDEFRETWENRDRAKEYSRSYQQSVRERLASNEEARIALQEKIYDLEQKEIERELEQKKHERTVEYRDAMDKFNLGMRTGSEERKLDGEKLWKCVLKLHISQIKKDLAVLSKKRKKYHRVGDYGEEIIDPRGWDMQLRYYIGAVLCHKGDWISPTGQDYNTSLDEYVRYFFEKNLEQPTIAHFFDKYHMAERLPSPDDRSGDEPANEILSTCSELERLILEYLSSYYHNLPYTEAMIFVIERMIENYDHASSSEVDEHP